VTNHAEGVPGRDVVPYEADCILVRPECVRSDGAAGNDECVVLVGGDLPKGFVDVSPRVVTPPTRTQPPVEASWVSIDASDTTLDAGESKEFEITVEPPADADRGDYSATVDLGIADPTRPNDRSYWQEISLNFQLWTAPEGPFETTFSVSESTTDATLTLDAHRPRTPDASSDADFNVTFVSPSGEEIKAEGASLTDSGRVTLGSQRRPGRTDGTYAADGVPVRTHPH